MTDHDAPARAAGLAEVRWASRVNPSTIRRLYQTDARGIVDEELIDEVGYGLYARCQSILQATAAHHGRITCPRCGQLIRRASLPTEKDVTIGCGSCAWQVRWGDYLETYQDKHLAGGGATEMHRVFVEEFARAGSPREKLLAIDRLIHTFHWELVSNPGRSAARELVYARNNTELLTFLDTLAYGDASTPGLRETKAEWDRKLDRSVWHWMTGFSPKRGTQGDANTENTEEGPRSQRQS